AQLPLQHLTATLELPQRVHGPPQLHVAAHRHSMGALVTAIDREHSLGRPQCLPRLLGLPLIARQVQQQFEVLRAQPLTRRGAPGKQTASSPWPTNRAAALLLPPGTDSCRPAAVRAWGRSTRPEPGAPASRVANCWSVPARFAS